jgi:hypothetical protein
LQSPQQLSLADRVVRDFAEPLVAHEENQINRYANLFQDKLPVERLADHALLDKPPGVPVFSSVM